MTENKAIEIIKREEQWESNASISKAFNTATQALEEVQQYRAIEKRLEEMYDGTLSLEQYVNFLEEQLTEPDKQQALKVRILTYEDAEKWDAYKAIGTPEQILASFNDGAATLEQSKVVIEAAMRKIEEYEAIGTVEECRDAREKQRAKRPICVSMAKDKDANVGNIGRCPCCNGIVDETMLWCEDCGQKLNWGD